MNSVLQHHILHLRDVNARLREDNERLKFAIKKLSTDIEQLNAALGRYGKRD